MSWGKNLWVQGLHLDHDPGNPKFLVLAIPNSNFCLHCPMRFLKVVLTSLTLKCGPLPEIVVSCSTAKIDKFLLGEKHLTDTDSLLCNYLLSRIDIPTKSNFPGQLALWCAATLFSVILGMGNSLSQAIPPKLKANVPPSLYFKPWIKFLFVHLAMICLLIWNRCRYCTWVVNNTHTHLYYSSDLYSIVTTVHMWLISKKNVII